MGNVMEAIYVSHELGLKDQASLDTHLHCC